eukprot:GDKI01024523.1.p1 GENE.GDKI01024523.1~~GDKI01024523.1.p1  ORF type:complete len:113 (+),score=32.83 GDKI01024523.1:151-489(+)
MSYKHFDFDKGADILGDEQMYKMMLNRYKDEFKSKVTVINDAWSKKDTKTLRTNAHSLKGSSGYVAATELFRICENIQKAIDKNDDASLPKLMTEFATIAVEAGKELEAIFK